MNNSSTEILPSTLSNSASLSSGLAGRAIAALECPKCGKHTIVKRSPNHFDCLNCNFQKSLPPLAHSPNESAYASPLSTSSNLYRLQKQAARATIEQQHRYDPYEKDTGKAQPLLFAAIAVIFGLLLL